VAIQDGKGYLAENMLLTGSNFDDLQLRAANFEYLRWAVRLDHTPF